MDEKEIKSLKPNYRQKENLKLFFYPEEWSKLMELANYKQQETYMILIHTGARFNEAKHIRVEDIDFERNNIVLKVTKVRAKKGEKKPNPRHIPISSKLTKHLKKMVRKYNLQPEDTFPMLNNPASNIALKKLAKKIGRKDFKDFSVHNIRKTFECWLIAIGIDGFKVAKHLGHDAQTAINEYISSDIFTYDDKKQIRDILGDLYGYNERRF